MLGMMGVSVHAGDKDGVSSPFLTWQENLVFEGADTRAGLVARPCW